MLHPLYGPNTIRLRSIKRIMPVSSPFASTIDFGCISNRNYILNSTFFHIVKLFLHSIYMELIFAYFNLVHFMYLFIIWVEVR